MQSFVLALSFLLFLVSCSSLPSPDRKKVFNELSALNPYKTVTVKQVGDLIVVVGELPSVQQYVDFSALVDSLHRPANGVRVVNRLSLSSKQRREILDVLNRRIGKNDIIVTEAYGVYWLEGVASNDYEADRAVEIGKKVLRYHHNYYPREIASKSQNPCDPRLRVCTLIDLLRISPRKAPTKK